MSTPLGSDNAPGRGLGTGSTIADIDLLLQAHADTMTPAVAQREALADAVDLLVASFGSGGRIVYVGAGTSGWLAALDAAEAVVTYGVRGRIDFVVAGGTNLDSSEMTLGDDDVDQARTDSVLNALTSADVLLAVSASGSTPFTVAALGVARARGAKIVALTNSPGSPMSQLADVCVDVETPGELIVGSTRLTAGLAQKIALNTLSTAVLVRSGRAIDGLMIAVEPLNQKLRERQLTAVASVSGSTPPEAAAAIEAADGRGDVAVVMLRRSLDAADAAALLESVYGNVRAAIAD